jgi:hypothetical protein
MLAKVVNKMGLGLDIDEEPLFPKELTQPQTRQQSKRTSNYTELEDKMIYEMGRGVDDNWTRSN